ncbi:kinase-like protein [Mytilinidion resinicola]|uniref:Kinase-like protein n=1 Tax=Mytilinidion resinicola TaxID=574789 RepID=A0A6A6Z9X2_9PEZI|nr:kinase-like protein [Mytilinidion resinicola]KAF2817816.1 kinase-like protein [Mytilinidion resinicola]
MKVLTKRAPDTLMVYKGLSFSDYMAFDPPTYNNHLAGIYRELEMLCTVLSPHANIMPPPIAFATFQQDRSGEPLICGSLYPYYPKLSLAAAIGEAVEFEVQIPLHYKAKWCFQLASALHHAHTVDGTWHQDLKTANMLLDNDANVVLIDWEQCGANSFVLAPEANGDYDLTLADMAASALKGDDAPVLYTRYAGPQRRNNYIGAPGWIVFPEWKKQCPKAVELAEVWSLGSVMWQLLEQVALEHLHDIVDVYEEGIKDGVVWTTMTEDIPESWKEVVGACRRKEPDERMRMKDVVGFWRGEAERFVG